ncbi:hypothetical protein [Halovivax gelatinilyticus]|uniref:hypothetical protein n=1 Tax=Halovivax gelatinilyticus TaxID=2961597 RepID=UPI0020CA457C|nr:hypothetical protein [Halovivax gelatinilyticus]
MDGTQIGLGVCLIGTASLLLVGRSQAPSDSVVYGMAGLAVALTIGAVAIAAIRNCETRAI